MLLIEILLLLLLIETGVRLEISHDCVAIRMMESLLLTGNTFTLLLLLSLLVSRKLHKIVDNRGMTLTIMASESSIHHLLAVRLN